MGTHNFKQAPFLAAVAFIQIRMFEMDLIYLYRRILSLKNLFPIAHFVSGDKHALHQTDPKH